MKKYIISILSAAAVLMLVQDVFAQQMQRRAAQAQGDPGLMHELAIVYGNQLELSEEQKREIAQIRAENRMQMREMRATGERQRDRTAMQQARAEQRNEVRERIHSVLTEGQRARLKELRAERMQTRDEMQQYMAEAYVQVVNDEAGLDDEKSERVTSIVKEHRSQMAETRAASREGDARNRAASVAALQESRAEMMAEIREVLTEEEFSLWSEQWSQLMPGTRPDRPRDGRRGMNRQQ
jgi:uncharacterized protein YdcH (DUF465 family)